MKAVVAASNQEKALVWAFSMITNLRMDPRFKLYCLARSLQLSLLLWPVLQPAHTRGRGLRGGAGGGRGHHSDMEWWWWLVIAGFIGAVAAVIAALFYWYRSSGKVVDEMYLILVPLFFRNHKCGCNFFSYCGEEDRKESADK